jgi:Spy/CpxP family protein refolding chaperone
MRQSARLALIRLHQLAVDERYDETRARQLAHVYSSASTALTLLDIQFASQLRHILTPQQRKALQSNIKNKRLERELNL